MERMRREDGVAKWSYYTDTSLKELENTTQPLKAEQGTSDRNLKLRPPEHGRKIISNRPKLSLLLTLFCRICALQFDTQHLPEFGFGSYVPPLYTNFGFHIKSLPLKHSTLKS
jgi:hypothetical protein